MNAKLTFGLTAGITGSLLLATALLVPAQAPAGSARAEVCSDSTSHLVRKLAHAPGESPRWHFHKGLIDREGRLAGSFGSSVEPRSRTLVGGIERLF
jgi:hypothetical protein